MKVVQINTVTSGCTGRIANSVKNLLENKGHQCILAYGRGDAASSSDIKISNKFDYNIHGLFTRIFDTAGLHSKYTTWQFLSFLKKYNPDIIHIHNLHGYYINYPMLFKYIKKYDKTVFLTLHDCWMFTGHCPYYTYENCQKWKTFCHHCQQKLHHPKSYVFDRSTRNFIDKKLAFGKVNKLKIITPSEWLKKEVEQSFLQEYDIIHIPNGIDLTSFHTTDNKFRREHKLEDKIVILGVANLWAETKGMEYFINLSEDLDDKYKVVLVGLSKSQKSKLSNKIIAIEKTQDLNELVDIYSSADVFANPTSEDNFPTTNIEALACGTPVITFKTGGSPEAIDNSCGIIIDNDYAKLKEACMLIGKKNPNTIDSCLKKSKEFSENICYERYINLYETI